MKENVFSKMPKDIPEELFETIVESKDVKNKVLEHAQDLSL